MYAWYARRQIAWEHPSIRSVWLRSSTTRRANRGTLPNVAISFHSWFCERGVLDRQNFLIGLEKFGNGEAPCQLGVNAVLPECPHLLSSLRVVHKVCKCLCKRQLVVGLHVNSRLMRCEAMLGQIEGKNGFCERHVFHYIYHRGTIVKRIRWVRIHANIGSGKVT